MTCPYQKEFDEMRDQFVERALHTAELSNLRKLRAAVGELHAAHQLGMRNPIRQSAATAEVLRAYEAQQ